jgi:hypothetical protein
MADVISFAKFKEERAEKRIFSLVRNKKTGVVHLRDPIMGSIGFPFAPGCDPLAFPTEGVYEAIEGTSRQMTCLRCWKKFGTPKRSATK